MNIRFEVNKLFVRSGMSLSRLAREAGLNYGTVFYFFKNDANMKILNVQKLVDVLEAKINREPRKKG